MNIYLSDHAVQSYELVECLHRCKVAGWMLSMCKWQAI